MGSCLQALFSSPLGFLRPVPLIKYILMSGLAGTGALAGQAACAGTLAVRTWWRARPWVSAACKRVQAACSRACAAERKRYRVWATQQATYGTNIPSTTITILLGTVFRCGLAGTAHAEADGMPAACVPRAQWAAPVLTRQPRRSVINPLLPPMAFVYMLVNFIINKFHLLYNTRPAYAAGGKVGVLFGRASSFRAAAPHGALQRPGTWALQRLSPAGCGMQHAATSLRCLQRMVRRAGIA